ncbi:MAG TPA: hypothetical protein VF283_22700 [Bryobacteraceae bacterium]
MQVGPRRFRLPEIDDYLVFGVPHVWLIDPRATRAWSYTRDRKREVVDLLTTAEPRIELAPAEIFTELDEEIETGTAVNFSRALQAEARPPFVAGRRGRPRNPMVCPTGSHNSSQFAFDSMEVAVFPIGSTLL